MQRPSLFILLVFALSAGNAQTSFRKITVKPIAPVVNTVTHKLGERTMQIKTYHYGESHNVVYINLHDDEMTSVGAAKRLLEIESGFLLRIENFKMRNIKFKLGGKYYTFDPNRMFSRIGIIQSLSMFGNISEAAINEVDRFAKRVLSLIPENPTCIIALHNNTNGKFSIKSFLPGNLREKDAKDLFVNKDEDPDDIFLTTDSILFRRLSNDRYNTIFQDNENAKKDGSLSIYCGEKGIRYVNCETEHGHDLQYQQMIQLVARHASGNEEEDEEVISYSYRVAPNTAFAPKNNTEIMFGEKKVGLIRSVLTDSSWATVGKLEIKKNFPLFSNMDLFVIPSEKSMPRFEVRIDPTRESEPLDPTKAILSIRPASF
jgi:hypothetical protein